MQYSAKVEGTELLQNAQTWPGRLTIPPSCHVEIYVDPASPVSFPWRTWFIIDTLFTLQKIGLPAPSDMLLQGEAIHFPKAGPSPQNKPNNVIQVNLLGEWLKGQVVVRPGWSEFHGSKHWTIQNAE